jgi:hypothetical protein
MYNKEYLNQISNKLDSLNRAAGNNPELRKSIQDSENFDPFSAMGASAKKFLDSKHQDSNPGIDPLFRDHNNYNL